MGKRISEEIKAKIRNLYNEGKRTCEIADALSLPYGTILNYTRAFKKGFNSPGEAVNNFAIQYGFSSWNEYLLSRSLAIGFRSRTEYEEYLALNNGFKSYIEYRDHLAKQRGFASRKEYENYRRLLRQNKPKNVKLSRLLKSRLIETSKSKKWLAREIDIPVTSIYSYFKGNCLPSKERLE